MQHMPQSLATRYEDGAVVSFEYEISNSNLNIAIISINGRYPENGFTSNAI